jgi:hypothetical protein
MKNLLDNFMSSTVALWLEKYLVFIPWNRTSGRIVAPMSYEPDTTTMYKPCDGIASAMKILTMKAHPAM